MKDWLYFFRITNWNNKIGGLRVAAYPVFGFALSGRLDLIEQAALLLSILGLIMTSYALNDYYDWKLLNEDNFFSDKVKRMPSLKDRAILVCFLPSILFLALILVSSQAVLLLFCTVFILVIGYSMPPLRFKARHILGLIVPSVSMTLVFLMAFLLMGNLSTEIMVLSLMIFGFQMYAELIHVIDDSTVDTETVKISESQAKVLLRAVPLAVTSISIIAAYYVDRVFFVSAFANLTRVLLAGSIDKKHIRKIRKKIWTLQWSLYEFIIYALLGITGYFQV